MKILFVHEVSYEKKPIFEMHEFPEHLAARGHSVTFIQFDEGFKFWKGNRRPRSTIIPGRVLPETEIKLVTPRQFGIPGLDRLFATLSVWPVLDRLLGSEKFDSIVLYAVPTYGYQVIRLAKKYGVPVIFRALDVSHLIRESFLSPLVKLAEKYVYHHSDVVSANNPAMARYCSSLGSRSGRTFTNLPPVDVSHFNANKVDRDKVAGLRNSLEITESDKVVTYMGSFFYFSGLEIVIRDFAVLNDPSLKLLLIGGGDQDGYLRQLVKDLKLGNRVIFTGFISYSELATYLQLATVAINPMLARPVSNTAFPHKVLQYMAAEIPVISTKLAGLFETFGPQSGVTWAHDPEEVLREAVLIAHDPNRAALAVKDQSTSVERLLSIDRAVGEFESLITSPGGHL